MAIIGSFDDVSQGKCWGWAVDDENQDLPIAVCLYKNNKLYTCIMADNNRPDIVTHPDVSNPYHGFMCLIDYNDGDIISAYALSLSSPTLVELTNSPITAKNVEPIGFFDEAKAGKLARGWAYDADAGENPISVHVYVDNDIYCMTTADKPRGDLTPVVGDPYHGWECDISELGKGTHTINAYAINYPPGKNIELDGSPKTVEITGPAGIWKEITGGELWRTGESLFHMKRFSRNGKLYGATEDSGKTVRFNDSKGYWEIDFDTDALGYGRWINSYHLGEFLPFLYTGFRNYFDTPTSIRIFRTEGTKWSFVHEEPNAQQARFVDDFLGGFITLLSSYSEGWTKIYRKTDPNSRDIGQLVKTLPYWNYGDPIVKDGKIYTGGRGIYTLDSNFNLDQIYNVNSDGQAAKGLTITSLHVFKGAKHATLSHGFRSKTGHGRLLRQSSSGIWKVVATFPEPELWCQETYFDELYVGTRKEGGGGKVYRIGENYIFEPIGTTKADGFFSLRSDGNKLFAGTYSLDQVRSYTWC